jgi:hypothetical protein
LRDFFPTNLFPILTITIAERTLERPLTQVEDILSQVSLFLVPQWFKKVLTVP